MSAAVEPLQIVSERRYTAEVPVSQELVSPEDVYATTKEEEWIKKKKKELTTTRQIETRVKRQVTLEDGKVVDDTGPIVTTNTTEDTETQEHQQTEHRTTGDDPPEDGYVAVSRPEGLLKEIKEKKVTSHEEKEERLETEDVEHMGDLCDKDYIAAIRQKQDVRAVLLANHDDGKKIVKKEPPRIIHQSSKSHKIIDSTDSHETKELHPDGKIVTETNKTTEREEIIERDDSDDGNDAIGEEKEITKESSQTVNKTKDEEFVEYFADGVKIGKEMRYSAEHTEVEKEGDRTMMDQDWDSLSTRIRKMRRQRAKLQNRGLPNGGEAVAGITALDRKDALTKKPVDFDEEEETRKLETNKWLEHHFGSESRSSKESLGENDLFPPAKNNTSFINVTMKSRPINGKSNAATSTSPVNGYSPGGHSSRVYVSSPEPQEISPVNYRVTRVTPWSERHHNSIEEVTEYRTLQKPEKVQVYPSVTKDVTVNRSAEKLRSQYSSSNGHLNRIPSEQRNGGIQYSMRNIPSPEYPNRNGTASPYTGKETPVNSSALSYNEEKCPSPPPRRKYQERMEMREEKFRSNLKSQNSYNSREAEREEIEPDEPAPDYSPTPPENRQNTPSPEIAPKKVYERTRFAADIPPVRRRSPPNQNNQNNNSKTHHSTTSIIGESIRKLVGKLRSSSSERKNKRRGRSPSPQSSPTYQQYHVIDNNIPDVDSSRSNSRTQGNMERRKVVQRFYLGEDPFGGSIYGREKEYDGVIPARSSRRHHKQDSEESRLHSSSYLSKSTSRLARNDSRAHREPSPVLDYSRTSQTLPRKSQYEKKQVSIQRSSDSSHWDSKLSRSSKPNSSSLINISFVNNVTPSQSSLNRGSSGPAKPARTYKSNLTRSKSFNVHGLDSGDSDLHNSVWKSNPQLHRLNESPPPLKSPGILASISRSQRDLTRSPITDQVDSSFTKSYNSSSILSNGYKTPETTDTKRRLFMKELKEQAPELYKTLHGDEIRTKSSSPVTSTPLRNGNSSRYLDYKSSFRLQDSENERKYPYKSSYMNGTTSPVNYTSGTTSPINNYTRGTTSPINNYTRGTSSPVHGTSSPINNFSRSTSSPINYSRGTSSPVNYSTTLNHTPSYKGYDGTTKSIVKKGSLNNDDYSETVRITSKSDDPNRPSVTNTVKSFSKKTIPKNGGVTTETIESSETTTTTKSRFKADKYGLRNGSPGGVVIEVRPSRR